MNNGTMVNINFRAAQIGVHLNQSDVKDPTTISFDHTSLIEESGNLCQLSNYVMQAIQQSGLTRWVLKNYNKLPKECNSLDVSFETESSPKLLFPNGSKAVVQKFDVNVEFQPNKSKLQLNTANYSKQNIAYSEFDNIFSKSNNKSILTFTEDTQGKMRGQVAYIDDNQDEVNFELEFIDDTLKR